MSFPEMMNGAKGQMRNGKVTFTYLDSYGEVITETKNILNPREIREKVMDRMKRFHSGGPGVRESETSRAERKWVSAHPIALLKDAWDKLDNHGKMEMSMMLSRDSHHGISNPKWAKAHEKDRSNIIGDNMVPL